MLSISNDMRHPVFPGHVEEFSLINRTLMGHLSKRFRPEYPWINMKYDISTGTDFPVEDELQGLSSVYSWIQGRGLESLALHAQWLESVGMSDEAYKLDQIIIIVRESLADAVRNCSGILPFTLDVIGKQKNKTLRSSGASDEKKSQWSYGDIFAARGLFCATERLREDSTREQEYCKKTVDAAFNGLIINDQPGLDPRNAVGKVNGRHTHAAFMLGVATTNLLWRMTGNPIYQGDGLRCIEHVLHTHVNENGKWPELPPWTFSEFVDDAGKPHVTPEGQILSDPGHAIEFCGLAAVFLDGIPEKDEQIQMLQQCLFPVFSNNFEIGYKKKPGGVVKSVDLNTGDIINPTYPWWSLPESIRTALALAANTDSASELSRCMKIYQQCRKDYLGHYVSPAGGMAGIQNITADGSISSVVPAVPDVDPGFHTGISFIDAIRYIKVLDSEDQYDSNGT